jgi:hypothetical protein
MLPPFIIEQIRQREERERASQEDARPRLEVPIERAPSRSDEDPSASDDDSERGVVILDLMG